MKRNQRRGKTGRRMIGWAEALESRRLLSATIYVDANPSITTHDGAAWSTAYSTLTQALTAASAGTEIHVADGTYKPTNRNTSFQLKSGVAIYGGYAGFGASNPDARNPSVTVTTLSGDLGIADSGSNNTSDDSLIVVNGTGADATAITDGFVITRASNFQAVNGSGAIYIGSGSPTISNCTITNNAAAGITSAGSSVSLSNCTISTSIHGMVITTGGAPTLTNCSFIRNGGTQAGGGVSIAAGAPTFIGCLFDGNFSSSTGGAAAVGGTTTFANCNFVGNSCTSTTAYGGALNIGSGTVNITNCDFVANTSSIGVASTFYFYGGNITVNNCLVWGNAGNNPVYIPSGTVSIASSDVQGGYTGTHDINSDPLFARSPSAGADGTWGTTDDDYGNLQISADSPVVDYGNNSAVPSGLTTDIAGNNRFQDVPTTTDAGFGTAPIVDMGAYEASPALISHTGGPYTVVHGQPLMLNGHGASTVAGALAYAWEWSGDGQFDDATGATPAFPSTNWPITGATVPISLRVTDAAGQSTISTGTVVVAPEVLYVDASATSGAHNGVSWNNAFTTLTAALSVALPHETIEMGQGIYKPTTSTDPTISFKLISGVNILGGYAGYGASNPDLRNTLLFTTTLSGDIGTVGNSADNSYHIVTSLNLTLPTVFDGLTVTGGIGGTSGASVGAGIACTGTAPTIQNCTFIANSATDGGGVYLNAFSTTSSLVYNCTFVGNAGSGLYLDDYATALIENCTFLGNTAFRGGAIYVSSDASPGATTKIVNCVAADNYANGGGGAIWGDFITIANCTIVANTASSDEAGLSSDPNTVTNCIFWHNIESTFDKELDTHFNTITYSDVTGITTGQGNFSADPQFIRLPSPGVDGVWGTSDDDYGNLRVAHTSPVIDAGNNSAVSMGITTDRDGNPRVADYPGAHDPGAIVDLGAYEAIAPLLITGGSFLPDGLSPSIALSFNNALATSSIASTDVMINAVLSDGSLGASVAATVWSYSSSTGQLVFTLPASVTDGNYRARMSVGSVSDTTGQALSADGSTDFFILTADANHDRIVNTLDFNALATNYGKAGTFSQGDFDYSGTIGSSDFDLLAARFGNYLAPPSGAATPDRAAVAATTTSFSVESFNLFGNQPMAPIDRLLN